MKSKLILPALLALTTGIIAHAQGTGFTYQGRLNDGTNPATGIYDLRFAIFDSSGGGTQHGPALTNVTTAVSNGLFTVVLNFGYEVFTGDPRWLEVAVRTNGGGAFTLLAPRQPVLSTPYAMHAQFAGDIEPGANVSFSANGVVSFHSPTPFYLGPQATNMVNNLNAQYLAGKDAGRFWWLGGNSGQLPTDYVLGTLDNNPLEIKVNGQPALRIDPAPDGPNLVGGLAGFRPTVIAGGVSGAVVAGGGAPAGPVTGYGWGDYHAVYDSDGTIGGGFGNKVGSDNTNANDAPFGTVAGGVFNTANNYASTVAGGDGNWAGGVRAAILGGAANWALSADSAVGGGVVNRIQGNSASGVIAGGQNNTINSNAPSSSIGGGEWNLVTGPYGVVPGGSGNTATSFALAAGRRAKANHAGAFVWADSTDADFTSTGNNQFVIRASGGLGIGTNNPQSALHVAGQVRATAFVGDGSQLTGIAPTPPPPGMVLIPAGTFTMGDTLDGMADAVPVTVTLSAFYMDVNEVSFSKWLSVYFWATNQGYGFANPGSGKAANHPVQTVSWYDCVKWCNARSQQAILTPVYYTDAGLTQVYTTGQVTVYANWSANGYRLPTEAEWEKAARGGLSGQRFPWGNVISLDLANYYGSAALYSYDLGPNGRHPVFADGVFPYTSPGGYFAPNGYGLNDMVGNVLEMCWDWYGTAYAGGSNPHGPSSGSYRVLRGGYWGYYANVQRCAHRISDTPSSANYGYGFRCVRGL